MGFPAFDEVGLYALGLRHGREHLLERDLRHGREHLLERDLRHGRDHLLERDLRHGRDHRLECDSHHIRTEFAIIFNDVYHLGGRSQRE